MAAYDYILIDATENDEHDRYSAEGSIDVLRVAMRDAIVDANVRAEGGLDDAMIHDLVMRLSAAGNGRGVGITGPGGHWRVIAERVA